MALRCQVDCTNLQLLNGIYVKNFLCGKTNNLECYYGKNITQIF